MNFSIKKYINFSSLFFLCYYRKARRKERDGDQNSSDNKLYLEENVLERKLPDADLKALVDLPAGLDYNEWLASHSKCFFCTYIYFYISIFPFLVKALNFFFFMKQQPTKYMYTLFNLNIVHEK